jgi:hypothetical protein
MLSRVRDRPAPLPSALTLYGSAVRRSRPVPAGAASTTTSARPPGGQQHLAHRRRRGEQAGVAGQLLQLDGAAVAEDRQAEDVGGGRVEQPQAHPPGGRGQQRVPRAVDDQLAAVPRQHDQLVVGLDQPWQVVHRPGDHHGSGQPGEQLPLDVAVRVRVVPGGAGAAGRAG